MELAALALEDGSESGSSTVEFLHTSQLVLKPRTCCSAWCLGTFWLVAVPHWLPIPVQWSLVMQVIHEHLWGDKNADLTLALGGC